MEHADAGDCPKGYFTHPDPPQAAQSQPQPPKPLPRSQWPDSIAAIADYREPEDKGIGDTIERGLSTMGLAFKAMAKLAWGGCKCDARRASLNAIYPY